MISTSTKSKADYCRRVRGTVRGLWNGDIDYFSFVQSIIDNVYRGYERAWREGSAVCGIRPEERTPEEALALDQQIQHALAAVMGFADYVAARPRSEGHLLRESAYRADIWCKRYDAVVTLAKATACADRKFKWELGPTREHCQDCAGYAGRIHRGRVWESVGARPQSRRLACSGYNCLCSLVPTDQPATSGRPPRPSG